MKIATKAQLDRAVKAEREVTRLRAMLESDDPMTSEEWSNTARQYADAKAERERANRVLININRMNGVMP